ncbi:cupin domain-containing protein [Fulvivirga sp. M361]|uniref:cupin domain-containing protein n=1 Tax=Fulvivirga sp. M361 TaxID=2594266 RepID=UPI00117B7DF7|nr:cupin domain-containing protein [Fulvivirga sp. M361]TRX58810.1 cupin domain-containing protein [Fulvivirga sp. M361]
MNHKSLKDIDSKELLPGFHGKFIHSENMTFAYWDIQAGSALPEHHHEHEQVANILEGEFEFIINGEITRCKTGDVVVLPSNTPHAGKALTYCRILDVFNPVREDYQ